MRWIYKKGHFFLKQTANMIVDQHNGIVPNQFHELIQFPGVGPKVALVTLEYAFGLIRGIPMDVHMMRIFKRLEWISSSNREHARLQIQAWLPHSFWSDMNITYAGLGQLLRQIESRKYVIDVATTLGEDVLTIVTSLAKDYTRKVTSKKKKE